MYQMLSANSEKCSNRKHHQHEAGLFSKGRSIVNRRKHNLAGNKQSKTSVVYHLPKNSGNFGWDVNGKTVLVCPNGNFPK